LLTPPTPPFPRHTTLITDRRVRNLPRRGPVGLHVAHARPPRDRRGALLHRPRHAEAPPGACMCTWSVGCGWVGAYDRAWCERMD
jgi:hypothetical protein